MQALTSASNYLGSRYLNDCVLYVTLEPCVMCCGGAYWSQLGKIVYGASDRRRGFSHLKNKITLSKTEIISGILEKDCEKILNDFFRNNSYLLALHMISYLPICPVRTQNPLGGVAGVEVGGRMWKGIGHGFT